VGTRIRQDRAEKYKPIVSKILIYILIDKIDKSIDRSNKKKTTLAAINAHGSKIQIIFQEFQAGEFY
jgi:hypothetical protein